MLNEDQQRFVNQWNAERGHQINSTPAYLLAKGEDAGPLATSTHFNPKLPLHSEYFKKLDAVLKCAERNANAADGSRVCQKEFKELRLAAFDGKLSYPQVNQKWFMQELAYKSNMSPY